MSRATTVFKYINEQREETEERVRLNIEQNRKGFATLRVADGKGHPIKGASVHARLIQHEFKHGANLFLLDEMESSEKNRLYKQRFAEAFNLATLPFYWKDVEPEQGKNRYGKDSPRIYRRPAPDLCMEYCTQHGIEPKLHCLNYMNYTPQWVPDDIKTTKRLLEKRFAEIAGRYADAIPGIEVINETLCWNSWNSRLLFREPDLLEWSFKLAEKYFPHNELIINEAAGIYQHYAQGNRMPYYMLVERALRNGARIDTVGTQFHLFFPQKDEEKRLDEFFNPRNLFAVLDNLAMLGKPLQITEITIPAYSDHPEDEKLQAELLRTFYSIWFSHPAMEAIIYWNLVDGYAFGAKPGDMSCGENVYRGGLLRFDLSPKPSYQVLHDLFHKEWHTDVTLESDENGCCRLHGFYGKYTLEIKADGKKVQKEIDFAKKGSRQISVSLTEKD